MGAPFSLAPSFAGSVDIGVLVVPCEASWGAKLTLPDLRSAEVAGDFSVP